MLHCLKRCLLAVQPILVLDNEEAVAEIMQLKNMPLAGTLTAASCLSVCLLLCSDLSFIW